MMTSARAREAAERGLRGRALEIQHDAPLAPVDGVEAWTVVAGSPCHAPRGIAFRRLHLDHVGAHVA